MWRRYDADGDRPAPGHDDGAGRWQQRRDERRRKHRRADDRPASFTCMSNTDGVTCTDERSSHGFTLARELYRMF